jgi:hypothetical protein
VGVRTPLVTTSLFPKPPAPPQRGWFVCNEAHPKKKLTRRWLAPPIPNELFAK